jgi:RNA polymerase sigma-70 factor (ECF subfamily)
MKGGLEVETLCVQRYEKQSMRYEPSHLVDEYADSVYKFCRSLTYSKEDAEDLFQETFLRAVEQHKKFEELENPQGFLFSTAVFIWKGWKRKYARRARIAPEGQFDETVAGNTDVEESYLIKEENRIVREIVDSLPDKLKIPTILFYTLEMRVPDIAATLQIPAGTVKSRLFKARKIVEKGLVAINYEK